MVVADADNTSPQIVMGPDGERMIMLKKFMLNTSGSPSLTRYIALNFVATLILSFSQPTLAQTVAKNFASADAGVASSVRGRPKQG